MSVPQRDLMVSALKTFGVRTAGGASPADARSGATVQRVVLPGGGPAYLKVAGTGVGGNTLAAAGRELRFYRGAVRVVPVRVPPLLGSFDIEEGVALLLGDAGEPRDVAAWSPGQWRALGGGLARLHTMPVPAGEWRRPDSLLEALADPDLDAVVAFWSGHLPGLDRLLAGRAALRGLLGDVPGVFVHGDCHTGNVLHGADAQVMCDWQESGVGRATSDLALLSVRATPSGTRVPAVVVEEYLRRRSGAGEVLDAVAFRWSLMREELAVLVFQWPPFAAYNDAAGVARVRRRARYLADRLLPRWEDGW
jgi:hypothetical protein